MAREDYKLKDLISVKKEDVQAKLKSAQLNQLSLIEIARLEGELSVLNLVDNICIKRGRY